MNSTQARHATIKTHAIAKSVPHLSTAMQMPLPKAIQAPHFETKSQAMPKFKAKLQTTPQFTAKPQTTPKFKARLQAKVMPKFKANPKTKAILQINHAKILANSILGHHLA